MSDSEEAGGDKSLTSLLDAVEYIQGFIQDFWLGGEIYWCINEARKCERRGLGASPSLATPPP